MLLKNFVFFAILLLHIPFPSFLYAQQGRIKQTLTNAENLHNFRNYKSAYTVSVWGKEGQPADSVLWEIPVQSDAFYMDQFTRHKIDSAYFNFRKAKLSIDTNTLKCAGNTGALIVLTKKVNDSISLIISKKNNMLLKEDIIYSFPVAKLKKWSFSNHPKGSFAQNPFLFLIA